MAQFASSTFTGTQFTELATFNAAFSKQTGYTGDLILGSGGTYLISNNAVNQGAYQHSGTPASADYEVSADIILQAGSTTPRQAGVCARMQAGANTMYWVIYGHDTTNIRLFKNVAGTQTQLGSSYSYTLSGTASLKLTVDGDQISVQLGGSTVIGPVTDTSITSAGKAGVWMFNTRQTGINDSMGLDNFSADDLGGGGGSSIAALMNHYRRRRA